MTTNPDALGTDDLNSPKGPDQEAASISLRGALEAIALVIEEPLTASAMASAIGVEEDDVVKELHEWSQHLTISNSGMDLRETAEGWRLYTRDCYAEIVERVLLSDTRGTLSRAALETLAVVAYKQPVTRSQVSAVRGVNVDGVVRTLQARGLIVENGVDPETGGALFCTTSLFLERLGLPDLEALPDLSPLLPTVELIDEINDEAAQRAAQKREKSNKQDS